MDFIEVYPNAIPTDLCGRLLRLLDTHSGVYQGKTGGGVDVSKKNSTDLMLDAHPELDGIRNELLNHTFEWVSNYFDKYSLALMGAVSVNVVSNSGEQTTLNPDNYGVLGKPKLADIIRYLFRSGSVNLQRYRKGSGGYPHWHSEQFPQIDSSDALHRVVFFMYYLNDVEDGGETEFFYQERKIRPKQGTLVVAPASFTHSHRGNIPLSEDKNIATSWILFNPANKLYRQSNK